MNTTPLAGTARAWWARWRTSRRSQLTEKDLTALEGLTPKTLKDIGAPEWIQVRALRAEESARPRSLFERNTLHWR